MREKVTRGMKRNTTKGETKGRKQYRARKCAAGGKIHVQEGKEGEEEGGKEEKEVLSGGGSGERREMEGRNGKE